LIVTAFWGAAAGVGVGTVETTGGVVAGVVFGGTVVVGDWVVGAASATDLGLANVEGAGEPEAGPWGAVEVDGVLCFGAALGDGTEGTASFDRWCATGAEPFVALGVPHAARTIAAPNSAAPWVSLRTERS
jgi:hypothetical protein